MINHSQPSLTIVVRHMFIAQRKKVPGGRQVGGRLVEASGSSWGCPGDGRGLKLGNLSGYSYLLTVVILVLILVAQIIPYNS